MDIKEQYFYWMYKMVNPGRRVSKSYIRLCKYLNSRTFIPTIRNDGNRADDGLYLRYRFKQDTGLRAIDDDECINGECSIFEMMVALSLRIEEDYMDDPVTGNRIWRWFHIMLNNLGLSEMSDEHFDERYVKKAINRFLNRKYEPNGKGGLFRIDNCPYDLRDVEIWYQMCWYFSSKL